MVLEPGSQTRLVEWSWSGQKQVVGVRVMKEGMLEDKPLAFRTQNHRVTGVAELLVAVR